MLVVDASCLESQMVWLNGTEWDSYWVFNLLMLGVPLINGTFSRTGRLHEAIFVILHSYLLNALVTKCEV